MGLLDRLKEATRGAFREVKPARGVPPASPEEVKSRLLAISGKGVQTAEDVDEIVIFWSAKGMGLGEPNVSYFYRALRIRLDEAAHTAFASGRTKDARAELADGLSLSAEWTAGQQFGFEDIDVLAWPGPEGDQPADEPFRFSWSLLRKPVIEAVTGAGWTYAPKQL
jgi:hypothetical protein